MTDFPAFRPTVYGERSHGEFPAEVATSLGGLTAVTRFSDKESAIPASLSFQLNQTEYLTLLAHIQEKGTVQSFLFNTVTMPAANTPTGYRWRYAGPPQVEDARNNLFIVSCSFVADFYPATLQFSETAYIILQAVETTVSLTPTSPPPAPSFAVAGLTAGNAIGGLVNVTGVQPGASWEYSLNGGSTWQEGSGAAFRLAEGSYAAGSIRVRATNEFASGTAAQNAATVVVHPANSAMIAFSCDAAATATGAVTLPRFAALLQARTSHPGWLRLYGSAAAATADSARLRTARRPTAAGVQLDPVFVAADEIMRFSPIEHAKNEESPATNSYSWRFTNDGTAGQVVIVLQYHFISS